MPSSCAGPNGSPARATPSSIPTTGLTRPISATEPAGIRLSPVNQATYAKAVPTTQM